MLTHTRPWPIWVCVAAGLLSLAPEVRAETARLNEGEPLSDLVMRAREARIAGNNKGWLELGQRVLKLAPDHPDLLISVGRALAANGRSDEALPYLEDAVRRGAGFDLSALAEFKSAPDTSRLRELREAALKNMAPVSPSEVFVAIQDESIQPEGITWDPIGRHLYIGSLKGTIWRVDLDGKLQRFAGPDTRLREVLGLKVDAKRRLLWAVTGVFPDIPPPPEPKKDMGITSLHAYQLGTGKRVRECGLDERPTLHGFNDMALASNGDVYATDTSTNAIYKLSAESGCKLDRILHDQTLTFPNGIVLTPDESRLYVAHVEGISAVDLRTGRRTLLAVPKNGAVNSIDGLALDGKNVLGVQGSPYFNRVARIRLADDGLSIGEVSTMSSRPPLNLRPTTGVVAGDHFYLVAGFPDAPPGQPQQRAHILRARLR
jgi:sugar lactone lactonase YvrE